MTDKSEITRYTYIGQRITSRNKGAKLVHAFIEHGKQESNVNFTYWPSVRARNFFGAQIGHVYEFDKLPPSWVEAEIPDERLNTDERLALQIVSKSEILKKRESGYKPDPNLQDMIKRLIAARRTVSSNQRLNFDIWLLNEIRKGY